jgi:hypothetical protein
MKSRWILTWALLLGIAMAHAQPAQILLIRHAEKPDDDNDPHLALRGQERAMALVPFLTRTREFLTNGLPVALFATRVTSNDRGYRTQETLGPLGRELKLPVQADYRGKDCGLLAERLLGDPALCGKTIVVCWVHESIPELVAALGVRSPPARWKGSVYDRVFLITLVEGWATLRDLPQRLLFGDSPR